MNPVYQCLRQLRRRLWRQCWMEGMIFSALVIGTAEIALAAFRLSEGQAPFESIHLAVGFAVIPVAGALLTWRRSWNWPAMARLADEQADSQDRFQSYLQFSQQKSPDALRDLALAETIAYSQRTRLQPAWRVPGWIWGLLPLMLVGLGLLLGYSHWSKATEKSREAAVELLRTSAPEIQALAEKWQEPSLEKMAEALLAKAAAISEALSADPRRAALEAIAKAEDAARAATGNASELTQAAQALAEASESRELSDAIGRGDYSRAAEIARKSPPAEIQRALAKAAQAKNLPALAALPESPNPGESTAQMLEQTARAAARNREADQLLATLQDLKMQSTAGGEPTQVTDAAAANQSTSTLKSETGAESEISIAKSKTSGPEGQGERDGGGTGEEIKPSPSGQSASAEGPKEMLASVMGPGDSLQRMVSSTSDDSQAKRRYQAIYEAAQADETAAVERESIPPSSRHLVKRYLESIRP